MTALRCIAVSSIGRVCGAPASVLDRDRGGMVCQFHDPEHGGGVEPQKLDPDRPVFVCPECFAIRGSRALLAVHLRSQHKFPEFMARDEAEKAKPKLPHEVER